MSQLLSSGQLTTAASSISVHVAEGPKSTVTATSFIVASLSVSDMRVRYCRTHFKNVISGVLDFIGDRSEDTEIVDTT
jgi:hypothetical protein